MRHDRRCVGVAGGQGWHDGSVDHAQALHTAHAQLAVDHRAIILAHAATADWMVDGLRLAPDEIGVLRIGSDRSLGEYRLAAVRVEGGLVEDVA